MHLKADILNWYGKSVIDLSDIYKARSTEPDFIDELIDLCKTEAPQIAATWLIKKHCENKAVFTQSQILQLYTSLSHLKKWQSKLHILQSMPYLAIAPSVKKTVEYFLRACLQQPEKFVRAWTYNGFYELAQQYPEYQEEAILFFEMAMRDEAPSVKARVRTIMKKGFN